MSRYYSTIGWAVFVVGSISLAFYGLTHGWGVAPSMLVQGVLTYIVCGVAEVVVPYRRDWMWLSDREVVTDVGHVILFDQSINYLYAIATVMVADYVLPAAASDMPVMIVLGVMYLEISEYWRHRYLHGSDTFWPLHAIHHHLDRMHIFRSGRVHFVDGMARVVFTFVPALLLGVPTTAILCWMILLTATGPISHSNLNIYTPKSLNILLVTPMVHRLHHASVDAHMRSNLAPLSPLVDLLFDTWLDPENNPVAEVGVVPDVVPTGFLGQLTFPFIGILRRLGLYSVEGGTKQVPNGPND